MAITQSNTTIVLNDLDSVFTSRARTTGSGTTTRITLDIKAEKLAVVVDPVLLGQGVAIAIQEAIKRGIRGITASASATTQLRRASAARNPNSRSNQKRYAGGRAAPSSPNAVPGGRLFNDSGRMADNLVARATRDGQWTMNVTKNRLDPSTFTGAAFQRMLGMLQRLVPVLANPALLGRDPLVVEAIAGVLPSIMATSAASAAAASRQAIGNALSKVKSLGSALGGFGGPEPQQDEEG